MVLRIALAKLETTQISMSVGEESSRKEDQKGGGERREGRIIIMH